jgi:hypothetical protein
MSTPVYSLAGLKRLVKDALKEYATQKQNKQTIKVNHFPSLRQYTVSSSTSSLSPFQKANVQRIVRRAKADASKLSLSSYPKLYEVMEEEKTTPQHKKTLVIFTSNLFPKCQSPLMIPMIPFSSPSSPFPFVVGMLLKQGKIIAMDIILLPSLPSPRKPTSVLPFPQEDLFQQIMPISSSIVNKKKEKKNLLKRL